MVDRQCFAPKTHRVLKPTFLAIRADFLIKQTLHILYELKIEAILGSLKFGGVFGDLPDTRLLLFARA